MMRLAVLMSIAAAIAAAQMVEGTSGNSTAKGIAGGPSGALAFNSSVSPSEGDIVPEVVPTLTGANTYLGLNIFRSARMILPERTAATLPDAAANLGTVFTVTDALSEGLCFGGGSARTPCISDGALWVPYGYKPLDITGSYIATISHEIETSNQTSSASTTLRGILKRVDATITVSRAFTHTGTAFPAGSVGRIGLYRATWNGTALTVTKVFESAEASFAIVNNPIWLSVAPTTITPGLYYFAWALSDVSSGALLGRATGTFQGNYYNGNSGIPAYITCGGFTYTPGASLPASCTASASAFPTPVVGFK